MDSAPSSAVSVLVVDDDEAIRDALCMALDDAGFSNVGAADGAEAFAWLEAHPSPGVIILDLQMPVMDGYAFRERQRVHPRLGDVPVIVSSAARAENARFETLGAVRVLAKPFDLERLLRVISELLHREHPR